MLCSDQNESGEHILKKSKDQTRTRPSCIYRRLHMRMFFGLMSAAFMLLARHYGGLGWMEAILRNLLVYSEARFHTYISGSGEIMIIFSVALATALPRFERPFSLVAYGLFTGFAYAFLVMFLLLQEYLVLPLISPVLTILCTSTLMQTLAWNGERSTRRKLEAIDIARQLCMDMLVHDLKKRISSVQMSLSMIRSEPSDDLIDMAEAGSARMLALVNNLLDIRKIQERGVMLHRERFSISELIRESITDQEAAKHAAHICIDTSAIEDTEFEGDRLLISRTLLNLIWNAIQYAEQGSTVYAACRQTDGDITLSITNSGRPVPELEQKEIFRTFRSGSSINNFKALGATGLGLAFCKLAVEAHGGTIRLQSPCPDAEGGVKVTVALPSL